jgi:hypothetical protein
VTCYGKDMAENNENYYIRTVIYITRREVKSL